MKKIISVTITLIIVMSLCISYAFAASFIDNGSFENVGANGWTLDDGFELSNISLTSGTYSLCHTGNSSSAVSDNFTLEIGKEYMMALYTYSPVPESSQVEISVDSYNFSVPVYNEWIRSAFIIQGTGNSEDITVTVTGKVYIDSLSIIEIADSFEILENGGFDGNSDGWSFHENGLMYYSNDEIDGHIGTVKNINGGGRTYYGKNRFSTIPVAPNSNYLFSGEFHVTDITTIGTYLDMNDMPGEITLYPIKSAEWTSVAGVWNSGSNTTTMVRAVSDPNRDSGKNTSSNGTVYVDNISFKEIVLGDEIPIDGSFENGAWKFNIGDVSDEFSTDGTYSAMLNAAGTVQANGGNTIEVRPNTDYYISAYRNRPSSSRSPESGIAIRNSSNELLCYITGVKYNQSSDEKELISGVWNSGNNTEIYISLESNGNNKVYFDDISICCYYTKSKLSVPFEHGNFEPCFIDEKWVSEGNVEFVNDICYDGTNSCKLTDASLSYSANLEKFTQYVISAYVRKSSSDAEIQINAGNFSVSSSQDTPEDEWVFISKRFATLTDTSVDVTFNTSGCVYIDKISLTKAEDTVIEKKTYLTADMLSSISGQLAYNFDNDGSGNNKINILDIATFDRGIRTHPNSSTDVQMVFNLDGKYDYFRCFLGKDGKIANHPANYPNRSVQFQVWVDDVLVAESPILGRNSQYWLEADVSGGQVMNLVHLRTSDGYSSDGSVWADAALYSEYTPDENIKLLRFDGLCDMKLEKDYKLGNNVVIENGLCSVNVAKENAAGKTHQISLNITENDEFNLKDYPYVKVKFRTNYPSTVQFYAVNNYTNDTPNDIYYSEFKNKNDGEWHTAELFFNLDGASSSTNFEAIDKTVWTAYHPKANDAIGSSNVVMPLFQFKNASSVSEDFYADIEYVAFFKTAHAMREYEKPDDAPLDYELEFKNLGAQIRKNTTNGVRSLRFGTRLKYDSQNFTNVEYGTVVAMGTETAEIDSENTQIISSKSENFKFTEEDGYIFFNTVISDIPKSGYNASFTLTPYIIYSIDNEKTVVYGEPITRSINDIMNTINERTDVWDIATIKYKDATWQDTRCFIGTTEKDSLSYEIGEEIVFNISLTVNGKLASCDTFKWNIVGDDGKTTSGTASGESGMLRLKTTLENPGFVMASVSAFDENGKEINEYIRFAGCAGVGIDTLDAYIEEPQDFDEYWAEALSELDTTPPEIIEMEEIAAQAGFKAYKMKLDCVGDTTKYTGNKYVSGYLTYPENAQPGSLKITANFQGYGVTSPVITYKDGYICFSVCAHSMEIGREDSYYSNIQSTQLQSYGMSTTINADPKNVYFRYMILRDLQALRFMREYFGENGRKLWDGKTIDLAGTSQGGFQAIALAALDKEIDSVELIVPWMCDVGGYTNGKRMGSALRPKLAEGIKYFDSVYFAKRINCKVTITAGLGDIVCPPCGIMAFYNTLECPKTLTFLQNRTHGYVPPTCDKFTFTNLSE